MASSLADVDIVIDDEFAALIPPPSADELTILEESLIRDGCRDPLRVTPRNTLLDGHNRLRICRQHDIRFSVEVVDVADREEELLWVIDNQLGRRNLPKPARIKLAMKREPLIRAIAKANSGTRTDLLQNSAGGSDSVVTREAAARLAGVSHDTYSKGKKVFEQGEPELVQAMETETVSIHAASQIAELPVEQQKAVVAAGDIRAAAKDLTGDRKPKGDDEWYTPPAYIEAARAVLGTIDLDPASCHAAQKRVTAKAYHDKSVDGLSQPWAGTVWLNPPFSRGLINRFVDKLLDEHSAGNVDAAVLLTNSETASGWFQRAVSKASRLCFPSQRIRFHGPNSKGGSPARGQAIFYFGPNGDRFTEVFGTSGVVLTAAGQAALNAEEGEVTETEAPPA